MDKYIYRKMVLIFYDSRFYEINEKVGIINEENHV